MYNLDTDAARGADEKGARINESGKYMGKFTRAENVTSSNGTKGVEFSFVADDGRSADFLTVWTLNKAGEQIYGYKTLNAIMTCLKVRTMAPVRATIEKYDYEAKERRPMEVEIFRELMDRPIGLILQMEEYLKGDGTTNWKPVIYAPFSSEGFTASEILNKATKPETVDKMLATLRDRPLKKSAQTSSIGPAPTGGFDDFDDTIPF